MTQVTADLIEDGIIEQIVPNTDIAESESANTRRGRPQVVLRLRALAATTAVVTLLLNRLEVTLFDYAGTKLLQTNKHIKTSDPVSYTHLTLPTILLV